jgi:hypothetical protein
MLNHMDAKIDRQFFQLCQLSCLSSISIMLRTELDINKLDHRLSLSTVEIEELERFLNFSCILNEADLRTFSLVVVCLFLGGNS